MADNKSKIVHVLNGEDETRKYYGEVEGSGGIIYWQDERIKNVYHLHKYFFNFKQLTQ